jgi:hypothetical protein
MIAFVAGLVILDLILVFVFLFFAVPSVDGWQKCLSFRHNHKKD